MQRCLVAAVCVTLAPAWRVAPHPRLVFGAEDLPAIQARLTQPPVSAMWARLLADTTCGREACPATPGDQYDESSAARRQAFIATVSGNATLCTASVAPLVQSLLSNARKRSMSTQAMRLQR